MFLNPSCFNILRDLEVIDLEPTYSYFKYKSYGVGIGCWTKHLVPYDSPDERVRVEGLYKRIIEAGLIDEVELKQKLFNNQIFFRIKSIPITRTTDDSLYKFKLDETRKLIQVTNGRIVEEYIFGSYFNMNLLGGYRDIISEDSIEYKREQELDCLKRLLEFIDKKELN